MESATQPSSEPIFYEFQHQPDTGKDVLETLPVHIDHPTPLFHPSRAPRPENAEDTAASLEDGSFREAYTREAFSIWDEFSRICSQRYVGFVHTDPYFYIDTKACLATRLFGQTYRKYLRKVYSPQSRGFIVFVFTMLVTCWMVALVYPHPVLLYILQICSILSIIHFFFVFQFFHPILLKLTLESFESTFLVTNLLLECLALAYLLNDNIRGGITLPFVFLSHYDILLTDVVPLSFRQFEHGFFNFLLDNNISQLERRTAKGRIQPLSMSASFDSFSSFLATPEEEDRFQIKGSSIHLESVRANVKKIFQTPQGNSFLFRCKWIWSCIRNLTYHSYSSIVMIIVCQLCLYFFVQNGVLANAENKTIDLVIFRWNSVSLCRTCCISIVFFTCKRLGRILQSPVRMTTTSRKCFRIPMVIEWKILMDYVASIVSEEFKANPRKGTSHVETTRLSVLGDESIVASVDDQTPLQGPRRLVAKTRSSITDTIHTGRDSVDYIPGLIPDSSDERFQLSPKHSLQRFASSHGSVASIDTVSISGDPLAQAGGSHSRRLSNQPLVGSSRPWRLQSLSEILKAPTPPRKIELPPLISKPHAPFPSTSIQLPPLVQGPSLSDPSSPSRLPPFTDTSLSVTKEAPNAKRMRSTTGSSNISSRASIPTLSAYIANQAQTKAQEGTEQNQVCSQDLGSRNIQEGANCIDSIPMANQQNATEVDGHISNHQQVHILSNSSSNVDNAEAPSQDEVDMRTKFGEGFKQELYDSQLHTMVVLCESGNGVYVDTAEDCGEWLFQKGQWGAMSRTLRMAAKYLMIPSLVVIVLMIFSLRERTDTNITLLIVFASLAIFQQLLVLLQFSRKCFLEIFSHLETSFLFLNFIIFLAFFFPYLGYENVFAYFVTTLMLTSSVVGIYVDAHPISFHPVSEKLQAVVKVWSEHGITRTADSFVILEILLALSHDAFLEYQERNIVRRFLLKEMKACKEAGVSGVSRWKAQFRLLPKINLTMTTVGLGTMMTMLIMIKNEGLGENEAFEIDTFLGHWTNKDILTSCALNIVLIFLKRFFSLILFPLRSLSFDRPMLRLPVVPFLSTLTKIRCM